MERDFFILMGVESFDGCVVWGFSFHEKTPSAFASTKGVKFSY